MLYLEKRNICVSEIQPCVYVRHYRMTYSAIYGLNSAPVAQIITPLRSRDKMQKLELYTENPVIKLS